MARLPQPVGIDTMLTDIARGIGDAGKLLPTRSRSDIGALALKTAKVKIDFEAARASGATRTGVSLLEGFVFNSTRKDASTTRGTIELEIVAILDREPGPPRGTPRPRDDDKDNKQNPPAGRDRPARAPGLIAGPPVGRRTTGAGGTAPTPTPAAPTPTPAPSRRPRGGTPAPVAPTPVNALSALRRELTKLKPADRKKAKALADRAQAALDAGDVAEAMRLMAVAAPLFGPN